MANATSSVGPAPSFDLKTLYSVAFQFTVGYTDVYVDNLSFYRTR